MPVTPPTSTESAQSSAPAGDQNKAPQSDATPKQATTPQSDNSVVLRTKAAQSNTPTVDVAAITGKLPKGSTVNFDKLTGTLSVQLRPNVSAAELDAAKKLLEASGAKVLNLAVLKDAGTETDTYDGGRAAAEYDLFTYVNQNPEHLVTIGNAMYWDGGSWVSRADGNLDPFTFLTYLDPDNPTISGSADAMKNFNQAVIDKLKNSDTFIKAIKNDSYPTGYTSNLYISRLYDHDSEDFLKGYQSVFVDMYQGYLDAYNNYNKLLDAEIKGNTTSYLYGVQGKNENWKTLNDEMNAALPDGSAEGYKYAYQDFINWLTADPHTETNPDDINTNRPLQAGIYELGTVNNGLTSGTWTGFGAKGQKIPTADKFWDIYSGLVFKDSGTNGAPLAGDGSAFSLSDTDGNSVTYPDILLKLGRKISDAVLDSFKKVYAAGVKQAALDALQGKRMAVDASYGVGVNSLGNKLTDKNDIKFLTDAGYFKDDIYKNTDLQNAFANGYRYVKFWLKDNTATLSKNPQNSFAFDEVNGYLVPSGPATKATGPSSKENPIDKAIIATLAGITSTYNIVPKRAGAAGKDDPELTVSNDTAIADNDKAGIYSAGHYMNTVYDLAVQIALQARADWTAMVESRVNGINQSTDLKVDTSSKWYQMSPYVYTTVFNALNKQFKTTSEADSWISKALRQADKDIITSASKNKGVPVLKDAKGNAPTVDLQDAVLGMKLNASAYYDASSYDTTAIGVSDQSTITNDAMSINFGLPSKTGIITTMQSVVNYAYNHEQAVAAAAYEAGYHAADNNLDPLTGLPAEAVYEKYQFQYRGDFIGSMYLNSTDFDNESNLVATYANSDGTTTEIEVSRDSDGNFTHIKAFIVDKTGNTISNVFESDDVNAAIKLQYAALDPDYDSGKDSDTKSIKVIPGTDSMNYVHIAAVDLTAKQPVFRIELQRNALTEVTPASAQGGSYSGYVYQHGYDYRRSYLSTIKVTQELKDGHKQLNPEIPTYYSFQGDNLLIPTRNDDGSYKDINLPDATGNSVSIKIDQSGKRQYIVKDKSGSELTGTPFKDVNGKAVPNKTEYKATDGSRILITENADNSISIAVFAAKKAFTAS